MNEINLKDFGLGNRKNPFAVPDGYFEHFTEEFMAKIPERTVIARNRSSWWHYSRYVAVAACLCGLIFGVASYVFDKEQEHTTALANQHNAEVAADDMVDYVMYDNNDIYIALCDY